MKDATKNKKPAQRAAAVLIALAMLFQTAVSNGFTARAVSVGEPFCEIFGMAADPETGIIVLPPSTLENGRMWTDKTVTTGRALIYDIAGKPADSVYAAADEFLVTLSAMSQSFTIDSIVEPTDTVFILDVSASMYINKLDTGESRIEALVRVLNDAIAALMQANPYNRVAVVAYGGKSGTSRVCPILKLDHYSVSDGIYFSMVGKTKITVTDKITDASLFDAANRTVTVEGGTPTQRGIYAGAKILLDNADRQASLFIGGQNVNVTRKPNIVLMTDGGPSMGWTDYRFLNSSSDTDTGFDCGNANNTDMGIDFLTVLTASYMKQMVHNHYYGADEMKKSVGFYSVGLDVDSTHAPATMNPYGAPNPPVAGRAFNAELVRQSFSGVIYVMKNLLDDFEAGGPVTFPALDKGASSVRSLRTVVNSGGLVATCDFPDEYYSAGSAAGLADAFGDISQKIVNRGSYSTRIDPDGSPDFDGFLIFSDVIGEYMAVRDIKGLWHENKRYDGHVFARDITGGDGAARDGFAEVFCEHQRIGELYPVSDAEAKALLDANAAAGKTNGGFYYNDDSDFSNKITFYADTERKYVGSYFDAGGAPAVKPAAAKCKVEMYVMRGDAVNPVTGAPTDLMGIVFYVITALEDGLFKCHYSESEELVRDLKAGDQVARWYIPASLIPMRTVEPAFDSAGQITSVRIADAVPVRFIYSVALRGGLQLSDVDGGYLSYYKTPGRDAVYFYTNQFDNPKNYSMAFFKPSPSNPYYFYTEDDADANGRVTLYTDTKGTPAAFYSAGTPYYTKAEVFDISAPGFLTTVYLPVMERVTNISNKGGVPYIAVGENKWEAKIYAVKTDNPTHTEMYSFLYESFYNSADEMIQLHYLMNNGRITVPFTEVSLIKEWDSKLGALIQTELVQLYGNGAPMGAPVEINPAAGITLPGNGNTETRHTWRPVPLYELTPDANGAAVFMHCTVAEGKLAAGVFAPYGDAEHFVINYYQPRFDIRQNKWEAAQISNIERDAFQRLISIEKSFFGLDPSKVFTTSPSAIELEIHADLGSGMQYVTSVYYPDHFTNGRVVINAAGTDIENFKFVEKNHSSIVAGYEWKPFADSDAPGIFNAATDGADYAMTLTGIPNKSTVSINLSNTYIPLNPPKITLGKIFAGSIGPDDLHDVTFEIEGWVDASMSERIFYAATHCHYIKNHGAFVLEYPGALLPAGYYTVTEYGAEDAVKRGDPHEYVHDYVMTANGADKIGPNTAGFWLGEGDEIDVVITNTYSRRAGLTLKKEIAGLSAAPEQPETFIFGLAGPGGYSQLISYSMFENGSYLFNDLPPGNYTVTETDAGVVAGYGGPSVQANGKAGDSFTLSLGYGENASVVFINTYALETNRPSVTPRPSSPTVTPTPAPNGDNNGGDNNDGGEEEKENEPDEPDMPQQDGGSDPPGEQDGLPPAETDGENENGGEDENDTAPPDMPIPHRPGNKLVPTDDGGYIEFDGDSDIPLGKWQKDGDKWAFVEFPPAGGPPEPEIEKEIPKTNSIAAPASAFIFGITAMLLVIAGWIVIFANKKHGKI